MHLRTIHASRWLWLSWLLPVMIGLGACGYRPPTFSVPGPSELTTRVRALLSSDDESAAEYRRARVELEEMGPEIDTVLVALAYDPTARAVVRANALMLLADRRSHAALSTLRWTLLTSREEIMRAAAVMGLHRLAPDSPEADNAVRGALSDPSRLVRLNALQGMDVQDATMIRELVRRERDPQVHFVARQLLALFEARGAPLANDPGGLYRTTLFQGESGLVYRPNAGPPQARIVSGRLDLDSGNGRLLPLADDVEMVRDVLPAFFSLDRSAVVLESARSILIRDLETRETIFVGPGVAPRPIPFTNAIVFLRQSPEGPRTTADGTELRYDVLRVEFTGENLRRIGELRVLARPDRFGYASPVRWMTVGETGDGWVLRVDGEPIFQRSHMFEIQEPAEDAEAS